MWAQKIKTEIIIALHFTYHIRAILQLAAIILF